MPQETFTQVVLRGLSKEGYSVKRISELLGVSTAAVATMKKGKRDLTAAEAFKLEDITGKSAGQFGCVAIEPGGGDFTEMITGLAEASRAMQSELRHKPAVSPASSHRFAKLAK